MRTDTHKNTLVFHLAGVLGLMAVIPACFQPDFRRECVLSEDCPQGQMCRFSSCIFLSDDDECVPTANLTEICDGLDNDCNGAVDAEDMAFVLEAGDCPDEPNAEPISCEAGQCVFKCLDGFFDVNENLGRGGDGCECGNLVCAGVGECSRDMAAEEIDRVCALPNAQVLGCSPSNECVRSCVEGFGDLSGDVLEMRRDVEQDGCECAISDEVCNGVDDDCDGRVDDLTVEADCPLTFGVCAGAKALCEGGQEVCGEGVYDAHAESAGLTFEGIIESLCDNQDNDCNGVVDEPCCQNNEESVQTPFTDQLEGNGTALAVAAGSEGVLMAIQEEGGFISVALVGDAGGAISNLRALAQIDDTDVSMKVVWTGERFAVLWMARNSAILNMRLVGASGGPEGEGSIQINVGQVAPDVVDFAAVALSDEVLAVAIPGNALRVHVLGVDGAVQRSHTLEDSRGLEEVIFAPQAMLAVDDRLFVAGDFLFFDGFNIQRETFIEALEDGGGEVSQVAVEYFPRQEGDEDEGGSLGASLLPDPEGVLLLHVSRERALDNTVILSRRLGPDLQALAEPRLIADTASQNPRLIDALWLDDGRHIAMSFYRIFRFSGEDSFQEPVLTFFDIESPGEGHQAPLAVDAPKLGGLPGIAPSPLGALAIVLASEEGGGTVAPAVGVYNRLGVGLCPQR